MSWHLLKYSSLGLGFGCVGRMTVQPPAPTTPENTMSVKIPTYAQAMNAMQYSQREAFVRLMEKAPEVNDSFKRLVTENIKQMRPLALKEQPDYRLLIKSQAVRAYIDLIESRGGEGANIFSDEECYDKDSIRKFIIASKLLLDLSERGKTFLENVDTYRKELEKTPDSGLKREENILIFALDGCASEEIQESVFETCKDEYQEFLDYADAMNKNHWENYYLKQQYKSFVALYVDTLWRTRYAATVLNIPMQDIPMDVVFNQLVCA